MTRAFRVAIALLSGIGLGGALAFLEKGAHVVLVSQSLEKMQAAVPKEYKRLPARVCESTPLAPPQYAQIFTHQQGLPVMRHVMTSAKQLELYITSDVWVSLRMSLTWLCSLLMTNCLDG
ncbi:hypothetical protein WJX79_003511 [Trebouxia sp. C0005]